MTSLAHCRRTHPLGFRSRSQLGLIVQGAEIGFLLRVVASALLSQTMDAVPVPAGEEHPLQGHLSLPQAGVTQPEPGSCAGGKEAARAGRKGAELREVSGKRPDKDRSMLERRERYLDTLGSDDHQVKGLDIGPGLSAAVCPRDSVGWEATSSEEVPWLSVLPCGAGEGWEGPRMEGGVKNGEEVAQVLPRL